MCAEPGRHRSKEDGLSAGTWLAVASGIALASACGLRAFLPLWILGLLGRAHVVPLAASMQWLSHDFALVALGVATVIEIAADKIPVVDHVLDVLGLAVRPAAAWLASYAVFRDWPTPWGQGASLALAVLALGIQVAKAKLRIGTTAVTLGHGNPLVSVVEDVASLVMALAALLAPVVALVVVIALFLAAARARRQTA
jgi:hypothetical protein